MAQMPSPQGFGSQIDMTPRLRAGVSRTVGVVDGAIGSEDRLSSLAALFPDVSFGSIGHEWGDSLNHSISLLITPVSALSPSEMDQTVRRLRAKPESLQVIVVLRDGDVLTTRRLTREGAADVLIEPISEPALALSVERLLTARKAAASETAEDTGQIVALLKAGGGVGVTSLAVQMAVGLAKRDQGEVCLVDLDIQFGAVASYMDLADAVTLPDVLAAGGGLDQVRYGDILSLHRSGARILAAPRDLTPLDAISPRETEAMLRGLRRAFPLTLIDLPAVWTAWTDQILQSSDRVVLVAQLTVQSILHAKRQLNSLTAHRLDDRQIILVCNAVSAEQHPGAVSVAAAERALERSFDAVIPEDRRTMFAAVNQGIELSAVRKGTKIEKMIERLAERVAGLDSTPSKSRKRP